MLFLIFIYKDSELPSSLLAGDSGISKCKLILYGCPTIKICCLFVNCTNADGKLQIPLSSLHDL